MINEPKLAQNGDILVTFDEEIEFDTNGRFVIEEADPWHLMVLGRIEADDQRVFLHSGTAGAEGDSVSGVRASKLSADFTKPEILILRITDTLLRNNFYKVVEAYARRVSEQKEKGALRYSSDIEVVEKNKDTGVTNVQVYMPTPFASQRNTNTKEMDHNEEWGLYRNIRAYQRYKVADETGTPAPMSKNKGIKCAQFVAYSYMVAILMKIFPNGLPEKITECFKRIENDRKTGENDIDNLMKEFHSIVKAELISAGQEKYFPLLCLHVKSADIRSICSNQLGFSNESDQSFEVEPIGFLSIAMVNNKMEYSVKSESEFPLHGKRIGIDNVDEEGNSSLFYAVKSRDIALVQELVRYGATVNMANKNGHSIIDLLEGPDFTFEQNDRKKIYMIILPYLNFNIKVDLNKLSVLLFQYASSKENELFNAFLSKCSHSIDTLNMRNENDLNLLHVVLSRSDSQKALALIKAGIDINAQTSNGNSGLMSILIMGSPLVKAPLKIEEVRELVKECLERNPNLSLKNKKGENVESLINEHYPNDVQLKMMLDCHTNKMESAQPTESQHAEFKHK